MKIIDPNKPRRDAERRLLKKAGWVAVPALKPNGAFCWRYIRAGRKKAYTRQRAVQLTKMGRV
jgi:hypothetical protein